MSTTVKEPKTFGKFATKVPTQFNTPIWFTWLGRGALTILLASLAIFYFKNVSNQGFWTDETTTFWQSGLAFPLPDKGLTGVQDMFAAVRGGSADPGGFNVFLLAWISIFGTAVESVRTFAFLFFIFYLAFLMFLIRWASLPTLIGATAISLMFLENITPYYAFELRPYMPELAASVGFLVLTLFLLQKQSTPRLFLFMGGTILLGSNQYSAAVLSITAGLIILFVLVRVRGKSSSRILFVAGFSALIWPVIQYALLRGIPLIAEQLPPTHTVDLLIASQNFQQVTQTLVTNFLAPTAMPRTLFILILPVLLMWRRSPYSPFERANSPVINLLTLMWSYVVLATFFSALLSIMGVMPWTLGTRWSINEIGLIAISLIGLLVLVAECLRDHFQTLLIQIGVSVVCMVLIMIGSVRIASAERDPAIPYLDALSEDLFSGKSGGLIVDNWIFEDIRYLIEASGRYETLAEPWLQVSPRRSPGFESATALAVRQFLADKSADRLLLRGETPIEGVSLPSAIEVLKSENNDYSPILLVKQPR